MAEWSLERSPWSSALPLEERTNWALKMVEKYRPEGVLFTGVWGCQFDPQYARYIGDAIKKEFGIPYMMNILEDVPVEIGKDGRYQMKGNTRTRLEGFIEMLRARRRER
ncbi:MAG: 2-hydroxyacyl-CoA dehydratase [Clostridia bacterium]|nr:2-hydroxyacyl-CoA dehydratase [Clostridia bacterium]